MTCTDRHLPRMRYQSGFNMIELIIVMVLVGILAAYAVPKMTAAINMQDEAWHDAVQSALRFAQKGAVARRRLTCVNIGSTAISITTASANPSAICDMTVTGPDGNVTFATATNSNAGTSVSPSGVIYFQPDGRATSDAAGQYSSSRTISMSDSSNIVVYGDTGYVE